jgi:histidinol dehydrogenase
LLERTASPAEEIRSKVGAIIDAIRDGGDRALRDANLRFGGGLPVDRASGEAPLVIGRRELDAARDALPPDLRQALEAMALNIERFHAAQLPERELWVDVAPGIRIGRLWRGLDRVAAYVPGGEAAYPSSLLMSAIPARLAGVGKLIVASPAARDGRVSPALLGAAGLMGVDTFYVMGGAQAIAALAYGTETIGAVDKIVGPGNAWVTAAKLEVFGQVAIDMPAGPSEVMVLADRSADPADAAADLLSQAEHGPDSAACLVTWDEALADRVEREVSRQLPHLPRQAFLQASLGSGGLIVIARDRDDAIEFVNEYAPEHLSVVVEHDDRALAQLRHAGSVFLGRYAPESAGDYATGSNHVLPTGRLARAFGALDVAAFGKWLQVQRVTREGLASVRETVGIVAEAEGLIAHRESVEIRFADEAVSDGR